MEFLRSLYDIVSGLGSFLLIPVFFFLLGLASRAGVQRSGQCALAVLGSSVGIQLLISTLGGRLVTVVNTMIDRYALSTGAANLHWQVAADLTAGRDILYWVLPAAVLINLLMLACRVTRVLHMDLWSLWQAAFVGVLVQQLTGILWMGLTAALLLFILQVILADIFTAPVGRVLGTSHVTFTQSFAVGAAPLAWLVTFLLNKIPGLRDRHFSLEHTKRGGFLLEPTLWGLIAGIIIGLAAGMSLYDTISFALVVAGCLFALPRLLRVFARAVGSVLDPIAEKNARRGRLPLNVAVNAVVGAANATSVLSAVILVPVAVVRVARVSRPLRLTTRTCRARVVPVCRMILPVPTFGMRQVGAVVLAVVLPGNLVLPQGDIAMLLYLMIFITALSGGCLVRSLITGLIGIVAMLYSGTLLTYLFSAAAGAMDPTTYTVGQFNTLCNTANPLSLLFVGGTSFGLAGIAALAVLVLGIVFLAARRLRRMTRRLAAPSAPAPEAPAKEN